MGPGPFGPDSALHTAGADRRVLLQWGRDLLVPDSAGRAGGRVPGRSGFNGAGTFWSRIAAQLSCVGARRARFNGAGTFWSRIGIGGQRMTLSDGMLQWGRDLLVPDSFPVAPGKHLGDRRFNGAGTFWSRIACLLRQPSRATHRFNGAGTFWSRIVLRRKGDNWELCSFNGAGTFWSRIGPSG